MSKKKGLKILSVAGVPIYVSWSWWIFAALIMVLFRPTFAQVLPTASSWWPWVVAAAFVGIMFVTVFLHELAHAIAALAFGWKVNDVTLNFWGGVTVYEHSASGKKPTPLRSLFVALVGPVANLLVAGLAWVALEALLDSSGTAVVLLNATIWTNLLIGVFNLLPGHPLDGGRIVESSVWAATGSRAKGLRAAGWSGRLIVVLLILGIVVLPFLQDRTVQLGNLVIAVLLGSMLWQAASSAIKVAQTQLTLETLSIQQLMTPVQTVDSRSTVETMFSELGSSLFANEYSQTPVAVIHLDPQTHHEVLIGVIDAQAVASVPEGAGGVPVIAVAKKTNPQARVGVYDEVEDLLASFSAYPHTVIAVIDDSKSPHTILGIVHPDTLAARLHA